MGRRPALLDQAVQEQHNPRGHGEDHPGAPPARQLASNFEQTGVAGQRPAQGQPARPPELDFHQISADQLSVIRGQLS